MNTNIYPRTNDLQTVYLNAVINNPHIKVGDYTIYNDFAKYDLIHGTFPLAVFYVLPESFCA